MEQRRGGERERDMKSSNPCIFIFLMINELDLIGQTTFTQSMNYTARLITLRFVHTWHRKFRATDVHGNAREHRFI